MKIADLTADPQNLGRRCFGMEISPEYVAVTLERTTTLACECKLDGRKQIKRKKAKTVKDARA